MIGQRARRLLLLAASRTAAGIVAAAAIPASALAEPPHAGSEKAPLDTVVLRDGRRLRGRILDEQPGAWITFETADGVRRTFAWHLVDEVVFDRARREGTDLDAARRAWRRRGNGGMSYELRAELTGALLPQSAFQLTGSCATGTGVAPASMYGKNASERGRALGGGLGGRVSYMYVPPIDSGGAASWWGMRVGGGLDLGALYAHVPEGLAEIRGELCSQVVKSRYPVLSTSAPVLLVQAPLSLGVHLGVGRFDEPTTWRGVVLGVAWAPSYVYVVGAGRTLDSHLNLVGVELTADFTTLHARRESSGPEAHLRISVSFAPSIDERQLMMGTLGFGAVWY